jgi:hypothetical protein
MAASFVAILIAVFVSMGIVLSGNESRAAQDRARARRIAEARMNARLLRLNV